jgi:hypothetical protein
VCLKLTNIWKRLINQEKSHDKLYYNIAFVNSERWLAKSRVDITQCQHGNVGKFLSLCFFVLYYKTNIKHFFRINWYIYSYINTRGNWENSKLCENTPPFGRRRVSTQFLVFPIPTRVDITVYQHGKCFIFVNCHPMWTVQHRKILGWHAMLLKTRGWSMPHVILKSRLDILPYGVNINPISVLLLVYIEQNNY